MPTPMRLFPLRDRCWPLTLHSSWQTQTGMTNQREPILFREAGMLRALCTCLVVWEMKKSGHPDLGHSSLFIWGRKTGRLIGVPWSPEDARIADSVLISITRIPETGWLKQKTFISRGSGASAAQDGRAGRFRICWEPVSLFLGGCLLSVPLYCGRDRRTLWGFFDKDTDLIHEGSSSKGPHLPRPSHWWLIKISTYELCACVCGVC